jgi:prolyl 4-hydroxylase
VWQALSKFYKDNKDKGELEEWARGYTYTNHWESPTYMVSVENPNLAGAGPHLKQLVWDGVSPIIEAWTGHKLKPTSQYGIRIYTNNSILATHVDRLPLVSSCIINVGQDDIEEAWPIEVYDHSGRAHNVTMEPGDMVLYEVCMPSNSYKSFWVAKTIQPQCNLITPNTIFFEIM